MSLPISFGKDDKAYGLLFSLGPLEKPHWEMSFYSSERGRKMGIRYLHKLLGAYCPILRFELTLSEIRQRGVLAPFIPGDRIGELENVVKPEWKHKGDKRPIWKDN